MDKEYCFDDYPRANRFYGGSDKKYAIRMDNKDYMLKISGTIGKANSLNTSYSNSPISEYIACKIIKSMDIDVQEVRLGTFRGKTAVACEDFTTPTQELVEFAKIENQIIDSAARGRIPILDNLEATFQSEFFRNDFQQQAKERYWDTFVIDAFLGNFDRHSGNWGYLNDKETGKLTNAPIYDCGSSLYPQIADDSLDRILYSKEEIEKRINNFPNATLFLHAGDQHKVNYKQYIAEMKNTDLNKAVLRIVPKIDMDKVYEIIDNTPIISDKRKEFYKTMLDERYKEILLEPYRQLERTQQQLQALQQIPDNMYDMDFSELLLCANNAAQSMTKESIKDDLKKVLDERCNDLEER